MITLSVTAADKIKELLKTRDDIGVRPGVQGGGCSGFKYKLSFVESPDTNDRILEDKGVTLYIDPKSYLYLMGTEINYVNDLNNSGFKFENPNAKRTCGCGESFSV